MSTYRPPPSACPTRLRPVPLITPAVTLGSVFPSKNPYGLPIAIAHSPMMSESELPRGATGKCCALMRSTARSFISSTPTTWAGVGRAVAQRDVDLRRAGHHVRVRDDHAVRPRNEPRARGRTWCGFAAGRRRSWRTGRSRARSTISVCTVTTDGATRATASVIAVRRALAMGGGGGGGGSAARRADWGGGVSCATGLRSIVAPTGAAGRGAARSTSEPAQCIQRCRLGRRARPRAASRGDARAMLCRELAQPLIQAAVRERMHEERPQDIGRDRRSRRRRRARTGRTAPACWGSAAIVSHSAPSSRKTATISRTTSVPSWPCRSS